MNNSITSYIHHLTPEAIRERLERMDSRDEKGSVIDSKAGEIASTVFHGVAASLLSGIVVRKLPESEMIERTAPDFIVEQLAEVSGEPYAYFATVPESESLTRYEVFAPIKLKERVEIVRLVMVMDENNDHYFPVDYMGSILSLHYWAARGCLSQDIADAVRNAFSGKSSEVLVVYELTDANERKNDGKWCEDTKLALTWCHYQGEAINVELKVNCDFYNRESEVSLAVESAADGETGPELDLMVPALEFLALLELEQGPAEELTAILGTILKSDTKGLITPSVLAERLDILAYKASWIHKRIFEDTCFDDRTLQTVYADASIVQYIRETLPVYTQERSNQLVAIPEQGFTDKQAMTLVALIGARVTRECLWLGFPSVVLIGVAEFAYTGTH